MGCKLEDMVEEVTEVISSIAKKSKAKAINKDNVLSHFIKEEELVNFIKPLLESKSSHATRTTSKLDPSVISKAKALMASSSKAPLPTEVKADSKSTPVFDTLPSYTKGQNTQTYAGIGSRETPPEVLQLMTKAAKWLEQKGYHLQTGKTFFNKEEGADKAFSDGTKDKTLFAPESIKIDSKEWQVAKELHPNFNALTKNWNGDKSSNKGLGGAKLMARNTNQVFGKDLDKPVDFVLFYAEETSNPLRPKGGTGQAVEMARRKGIPAINMADKDWKNQLTQTLKDAKSTENKSTVKVAPLQEIRAGKVEGIDTLRQYNTNKHFGNPFGTKYGTGALIQTNIAEDGVVSDMYRNWIVNDTIPQEYKSKLSAKQLQDLKEQRDYIVNEIVSGNLDGKTLLYFRDTGKTNHAKMLAEIVNNRKNIKFSSAESEQFTDTSKGYYKGNIEKLGENQVFVFGSNNRSYNGNPSKGTGGAALHALTNNWIEQKENMSNRFSKSGKAYGLLTIKDPFTSPKKLLTKKDLKKSVERLYREAINNPDKEFLVAYTHTGMTKSLNGFTANEMIEVFKSAGTSPNNIVFNKEWNSLIKTDNESVLLSTYQQQLADKAEQVLGKVITVKKYTPLEGLYDFVRGVTTTGMNYGNQVRVMDYNGAIKALKESTDDKALLDNIKQSKQALLKNITGTNNKAYDQWLKDNPFNVTSIDKEDIIKKLEKERDAEHKSIEHELTHPIVEKFILVNEGLSVDKQHPVYKRMVKLFRTLKGKETKAFKDIENNYWKTNLHEFMSEAMSNEELQKAMNKTRYGSQLNRGTLFDEFIKLVSTILKLRTSVKDGSALEEVIDIIPNVPNKKKVEMVEEATHTKNKESLRDKTKHNKPEKKYILQGKFEANEDQKELIDKALDFVTKDSKEIKDNVMMVQGRGGTGKSTTIGRVIELVAEQENVSFKGVTFTHVAKDVLNEMTESMKPSIPKQISTTASFLGFFKPGTDKGRYGVPFDHTKFSKPEFSKVVLVLDEASMLSQDEYLGLLQYVKQQEGMVKLIVMGDYHQLPPIPGDKVYTKASNDTFVSPTLSPFIGKRNIDNTFPNASEVMEMQDSLVTHELKEVMRQKSGTQLAKLISNEANKVDTELGQNHLSKTVEIVEDETISFPSTSEQRKAFKKHFKEDPVKTKLITYNNATVAGWTKTIRENVLFIPEQASKDPLVVDGDITVLYGNLDQSTYTNGSQYNVKYRDYSRTTESNSDSDLGQLQYAKVGWNKGVELELIKLENVTTKHPMEIELPIGFMKELSILLEKSPKLSVQKAYASVLDRHTTTYKLGRDGWYKTSAMKLSEREVSLMKPTMIPFYYAYAITSYKSQGQTIDTVFFDPATKSVDGKKGEFVKAASAYTAVSRTKKKLYYLMTKEDYNKTLNINNDTTPEVKLTPDNEKPVGGDLIVKNKITDELSELLIELSYSDAEKARKMFAKVIGKRTYEQFTDWVKKNFTKISEVKSETKLTPLKDLSNSEVKLTPLSENKSLNSEVQLDPDLLNNLCV